MKVVKIVLGEDIRIIEIDEDTITVKELYKMIQKKFNIQNQTFSSRFVLTSKNEDDSFSAVTNDNTLQYLLKKDINLYLIKFLSFLNVAYCCSILKCFPQKAIP